MPNRNILTNGKIYDLTEDEPLECTCGCHWFTKTEMTRYKKGYNTVLGGTLPSLDNNIFIVYKCGACSKVNIPSVSLTGANLRLVKQFEELCKELGIT
jgi:DNA-directed RNA polymerase subunit RPC12/RpoP